jgi:RNA 3'-terminal phosphate cyclase (ATP)
MALADGGSFTVRELTEHTRTNIWLIEQFLPVKFKVEKQDGLWFITAE